MRVVPNRQGDRIADVPATVVVDVANVMGARADGWWRDRAGAAARLGREIIALAARGTGPDAGFVLVLEGQARAAAAVLENAVLENAKLENAKSENAKLESPRVRIVSAAGSGDDAIAGIVAEIVGATPGKASCLVVTADRELRRRCERLGATAAGPGWLLSLL